LAKALRKNFSLVYLGLDKRAEQTEQFCQRNQKANAKRIQFQIFFQQQIKK
jgi:hypothetical protein